MRGREEIEALIPHAGAMCLLDRVVHSDGDGIECRAVSHHWPDNPLRYGASLPIEAGIEYAAQAMALHLGLNGRGGPPRQGYLVMLNDTTWQADRLDDVTGELQIHARLQQASGQGSEYAFRIAAAGQTRLAGEALVVLDGDAA